MAYTSTIIETQKPHRETTSCAEKSASRKIFASNRNCVYQIGRNSLKAQQEKSQTPTKTASGVFFYKYRHYSPELGRWPSRDPIEEYGGVNLYIFVGNDPLSYFDLLGLEGKKCLFIAKDQTQKGSEKYKELVKAAKEAGFEVVENATGNDLNDAWKSKKYDNIIYHTHGSRTGSLTYGYKGTRGITKGKYLENSRPVKQIFSPTKGSAKNLNIACCHPDKVITDKLKKEYKKHGINIDGVNAKQNKDGSVNRSENRQKIIDLLEKIKKDKESKCCEKK